ncbi:cGMP-inhibited 3',5'-cyclic phosphodiesterase B [Grus japonensis]|uniref:cGMP-inhibited 3',5'-cyclic phosphodiesterase B n=1 Tax=Grus japonensis TaxID=30415 RepID=A0ABC9WX96_GRUJA
MREEREAAAASHHGPSKPPQHCQQPDGGGAAAPLALPSGSSPESLRNGYVKTCATPLRQDPPKSFLSLLLFPTAAAAASSRALLSLGALAAVVLSLLAFHGQGSAGDQQDGIGWRSPWPLHALLCLSCCLSSLFSIACAFFFLTCYLAGVRRGEHGGGTTRWWLLALPVCCYSGDFVALQWLLPAEGHEEEPQAPAEPHMVLGRLLTVLGSVASRADPAAEPPEVAPEPPRLGLLQPGVARVAHQPSLAPPSPQTAVGRLGRGGRLPPGTLWRGTRHLLGSEPRSAPPASSPPTVFQRGGKSACDQTQEEI